MGGWRAFAGDRWRVLRVAGVIARAGGGTAAGGGGGRGRGAESKGEGGMRGVVALEPLAFTQSSQTIAKGKREILSASRIRALRRNSYLPRTPCHRP